ncbi:hypothetical protein SAMN06266787_1086 [Halorubrum ezzemoulense]|uniref:Uncharacterized protein n=1 Tax=Halorubrum ezzemoulense TaxID=337243 RepID=A0A238Y1H1_HALEZ|nr:hypothetical protein SAMN06266787_1086 [Halorubrum ezzemoulense]
MYECKQQLEDGQLLDCWGTFISKRVIPVNDERVAVFTLRVADELIPFVLGPAHAANMMGWGVGDLIEIRSALLCESTSRQITVGTCPSCGGDLRQPAAHSVAPVADGVFSALSELDDDRFLLAIPGTVPVEGDTRDTDHRSAAASRPDWLTIPDPVCKDCGYTTEL